VASTELPWDEILIKSEQLKVKKEKKMRTVQGSEAEESATPQRLSLISWREVERSGVCFGMGMAQDRERILALHQRSFDFTCGVIDAYPKRPGVDDPSRLIWRQLIKAASSATFNLEEADAASSDNDFLAKMRIALREAKESHVGIRIVVRCQLAGWQQLQGFQDEARQLAAIFGKIIVNKKASMKRCAHASTHF
jgi:four helix bundle protein